MGKKVFSSCIVILLCSWLHISCKKATSKDNGIEFDSLKISEVYHLFGDIKKPSCNLEIHFTFPSKFENVVALEKIQALFINKIFGVDFEKLSPSQAVDSYKEWYISEFKRYESELKLEKDDTEEGDMAATPAHLFFLKLNNDIKFNRDGLLSFVVKYSNYEGGAHVAHSLYAYVVDLKTGNFLTEEDIFADNVQKQISKIMVKEIIQQNGLKDSEQLENLGYSSVNDIIPNGNFIVDDKGITYFFNEDEIAPYFIGQTTVFLPYEKINIYLSEDSPISVLWN